MNWSRPWPPGLLGESWGIPTRGSPQAQSPHPRSLWSSQQGHLSSRVEKPSCPLATQGHGRGGQLRGLCTPKASIFPKVTYQRQSQEGFQMTRRQGLRCRPVTADRLGKLRSVVTVNTPRDRFVDACPTPHLCLLALLIHICLC